MKVREVFLLQQGAIKKLLSNIHRVGEDSVIGLCELSKIVLTSKEKECFRLLLIEYACKIRKNLDDYLWSPYDAEPRKIWLEEQLEKVNKKLEMLKMIEYMDKIDEEYESNGE